MPVARPYLIVFAMKSPYNLLLQSLTWGPPPGSMPSSSAPGVAWHSFVHQRSLWHFEVHNLEFVNAKSLNIDFPIEEVLIVQDLVSSEEPGFKSDFPAEQLARWGQAPAETSAATSSANRSIRPPRSEPANTTDMRVKHPWLAQYLQAPKQTVATAAASSSFRPGLPGHPLARICRSKPHPSWVL